MILLLTGLPTLAALPGILLTLLCIAVFLGLVYLIVSWFPGIAATWAWRIVLILAGIILLIWLIQLATGGAAK